MPLPLNDKQVGDIGHADDHNAIVNEINLLISASNNYLPISASNNFILVSSSAALATSIVSTIVDSAPSTLDTLNELAAAIGDDPNFAASTASAIGERLTSANASATYLSKVDAGTTYLPISASSNYLPTSSSSNYLPVSASSNYLQTANASATYAKLESPTFTGTPLAPTASSGTNTTQIATTEFVTSAVLAAQSGSVDLSSYLTIINASATYLPISSSSNYLFIDAASAQYLTKTDAASTYFPISSSAALLTETEASSIYAPLSSPTFTGTPAAPNPAADTNTTQLATTAYVVGQATSSLPSRVGLNIAAWAVGTSTRFARADHVHAPALGEINAQISGYTLVTADVGRLVEMGSAAAITLTVPTNSTLVASTGSSIEILRTGTGEVSIAGAGGVTINSEGGKLRINAQWQAVTLVNRGTNTWVLIGALKT